MSAAIRHMTTISQYWRLNTPLAAAFMALRSITVFFSLLLISPQYQQVHSVGLCCQTENA